MEWTWLDALFRIWGSEKQITFGDDNQKRSSRVATKEATARARAKYRGSFGFAQDRLLHCAADDGAVRCFGRDDVSYGGSRTTEGGFPFGLIVIDRPGVPIVAHHST
jgi:hypothetical protein